MHVLEDDCKHDGGNEKVSSTRELRVQFITLENQVKELESIHRVCMVWNMTINMKVGMTSL